MNAYAQLFSFLFVVNCLRFRCNYIYAQHAAAIHARKRCCERSQCAGTSIHRPPDDFFFSFDAHRTRLECRPRVYLIQVYNLNVRTGAPAGMGHGSSGVEKCAVFSQEEHPKLCTG